MRQFSPFRADDLEELDERLLSHAARVVAIEDVYDGDRAANVIGLRHDCDNEGSLRTATRMARWEAERGYRSTYYLLHTSPYWIGPYFERHVAEIADCGHEIGIHVNALAHSLRTGEDPDEILLEAVGRLRDLGYPVRGAAGHGDALCIRNRDEWESPFANDEQFLECRREKFGDSDREISRGPASLTLNPKPFAYFGLEYEALFLGLPWPFRFADSGGRWLEPGFDWLAERFAAQADIDREPLNPMQPLQLHLLIHPDWWERAFQAETVAA
jgi:hypothetical protein